MLRDRAVPVDLFALVPALHLRFEPELAELDRLLEDVSPATYRCSGSIYRCPSKAEPELAQAYVGMAAR